MEMEMKRAFEPAEIGAREECGICSVGFVTGVVAVHVLHHDLGVVCPSCVEYLGGRNPERFPTIGDLEEANQRYTEPVFPSLERVLELEDAEDPAVHEAYFASWIQRTPA